jgi:predicted ATPase
MKNNNWYVITGGPCSGKTTTLEIIEKKGYKVEYETARFWIEQELKKGKTLEEMRKDEYLFQKKILELKIENEKKFPKDKLIFIERGIPDTLSYYDQSCGIKEDTLLKKALKTCSYKKVFLFELLDYQKDYARLENAKEAKELEDFLKRDYEKLGMTVVYVPKMSIEKRVKFILDNL